MRDIGAGHFEPAPLQYLLVKLVSRCNIDCDYCYWFRDASVYRQPKRMSPRTEDIFLSRLREHIEKFAITDFSILLHGGEPLLFGLARFSSLIANLKALGHQLGCSIDISITTNGTLVDEQWAAIFHDNQIAVSVSVDGPPSLNDTHRRTFAGDGTYDAVARGIKFLRAANVDVQLLAVADPVSNPDEVIRTFVDELGISKFDIMIPDMTRDDICPPISAYYKTLFDIWYYKYSIEGVDIRFTKEVVRGLLGGLSKVESTGLGPITSVTLLPNGGLEPLDVARIAGDSSTITGLNIETSAIQDITKTPLWREIYESALRPHSSCRECRFLGACGGGYLPHRFSEATRFDNPSVYCADLKDIFTHVENALQGDI